MVTLGEITTNLKKLDNWTLDSNFIIKQIEFLDLRRAALYVTKISEICEKLNYSPDIVITQSSVRLTLPSLMRKELSEEDFKLAEEIDKIESEF